MNIFIAFEFNSRYRSGSGHTIVTVDWTEMTRDNLKELKEEIQSCMNYNSVVITFWRPTRINVNDN